METELKGYKAKTMKKDSEYTVLAIRERWVLWTEPADPLPFVLLLPKNMEGKLSFVITPHGHDRSTEGCGYYPLGFLVIANCPSEMKGAVITKPMHGLL